MISTAFVMDLSSGRRSPAMRVTDARGVQAHQRYLREDRVEYTAFSTGSGSGRIVTAMIERPAATVVELHGDIDLEVVQPLRDCVLSGVEQCADVLVELADVTLIDCACLGALVQGSRLADRRGHTLCLVAVPPPVQQTLIAAGLDTAFPTFGDRREALQELSPESCVLV